jgi:GABA(A) receptor-associated protein
MLKTKDEFLVDNIFKKTLSERKLYSAKLLTKFPDRVPVVLTPRKDSTNVKNKYLMPRHIRISELLVIFRTIIKIDSSKAIFIFVNNSLIPMNNSVEEIYNTYKDTDGFLYITYAYENTFG